VQTTDPLAPAWITDCTCQQSIADPSGVRDRVLRSTTCCSRPNDEAPERKVADFDALAPNNRLVMYELPTAWGRSSGGDGFERAVGTFRDARARIEPGFEATNFSELTVMRARQVRGSPTHPSRFCRGAPASGRCHEPRGRSAGVGAALLVNPHVLHHAFGNIEDAGRRCACTSARSLTTHCGVTRHVSTVAIASL